MKKLIIILALAASMPAIACKDSMRFTPDKQKHFAASAAIAAGVGAAVDPIAGFWTAALVGAAKEAYDAGHKDKHCPSLQDLAFDLAGAALGAYGVSLIITPKETRISWFKQF